MSVFFAYHAGVDSSSQISILAISSVKILFLSIAAVKCSQFKSFKVTI